MSSVRTIFITGAGTGIGAATARLFAREGWRVAGSALQADHLATVQADLGERFVPFVTDVRDRRGMCDAVADFAGRHGAGKLDARPNTAHPTMRSTARRSSSCAATPRRWRSSTVAAASRSAASTSRT